MAGLSTTTRNVVSNFVMFFMLSLWIEFFSAKTVVIRSYTFRSRLHYCGEVGRGRGVGRGLGVVRGVGVTVGVGLTVALGVGVGVGP